MNKLEEKQGIIVASWGPVHGAGKITVTNNLLSTYIALTEERKQVLTFDSQMDYGRVQETLKPDAEDGTSQIFTFAHSKNLTPEYMRLYATPVIENKLYLLGAAKQKLVAEQIMGCFKSILDNARKTYDYVLVDTNAGVGTYNQITPEVLQSADIIMVNLPQDDYVLKNFFSKKEGYWHPMLEETDYIPIIGNYIPYNHYSIKKIKRRYRLKEVYNIPHNIELHKAIMDQRFLRWMESNYDVEGRDDNKELMNQLRAITKRITRKRKGKGFLFTEEEEERELNEHTPR